MPHGRVGSNLCIGVLNQSRSLVCHNEPLTVIKKASGDLPGAAVWSKQLEALNEILAKPVPPTPVVKIAASSIADVDGFVRLVADTQPRLIILDRHSMVHTVVSQVRAEEYAAWTLRTEGRAWWGLRTQAADPDVRPRIDRDRFELEVTNISVGRAICDRAARASAAGAARLYYEDLRDDLTGFMSALIEYCGIEQFRYELRFRKFSAEDLDKDVSNPDDVRRMAMELSIA